MKKYLSTKAISSIVLNTATTQLNFAIDVYGGETTKIDLLKAMYEARHTLFILETLFFCEEEMAMSNKIKEIRQKLLKASDLDKASQVAKECVEDIKNLEYEIVKEIEKPDFPPSKC